MPTYNYTGGVRLSLTRYVWETKIDRVIKKEITVGGRKSADGTSELFTENAGWHLVIGHMSIYVGDDEPPFKDGDSIRLIVEKKP